VQPVLKSYYQRFKISLPESTLDPSTSNEIASCLTDTDKYLMSRDYGYFIDGDLGSEMRFANASCKLNAAFVTWRGYKKGTNKTNRIFIVATNIFKLRRLSTFISTAAPKDL
jgi:hypothetical protein